MVEPNTEEQEIVEEGLENEKPDDAAEEVVSSEENAEGGEEAEGEEAEEEERKPSRRESLRIQALVSKLKQKEEAPERRNDGLNYKTALDADDETLTKLEEDRTGYGDRRYNEGLEQAKSIQFHTRLEIDAPKVEAKYPVLDKESPKFNPAVADAINSWYLATTGFDAKTNRVANADIRYKDFVEGIMELSDEMAGEKVATTKKNIAKQAATTGLRPSGGTAKRLNLNQTPGAMSDEELKAVIAQSIPSK